MVDLENTILFEDMLSNANQGQTFKLVWPLDLELASGSQKIKLLFKNEKTGFYFIGKIAPEYLSYCTIGSRFRDGKKIYGQSGSIFTCRIATKERNPILQASEALTDKEYDLSYSFKVKNPDGSYRTVDRSNFCKHQRCLVFKEGSDKIVIPCAVVGAMYYFTSTSMREQVLTQNLRGLYEEVSLDLAAKKASILLKPNASYDDALRIARFALDSHAQSCWDFIMNYVRVNRRTSKNGESYCPLAAEIPVMQELNLKVRGQRIQNAEGGTTLIVFEILEENSRYPFEALELQRRRPNRSKVIPPITISRFEAKPNNRLVNGKPSRKYRPVSIERPQNQSDSHQLTIEVTKVLIPPRQDAPPSGGARFITEGEEEASLSSERETGGEQQKAKGNLFNEEGRKGPAKDSYEMPLQDFITMAKGLADMEGVTDFSVSSPAAMPQKFRDLSRKLSLRESYNGGRNSRRRYVTVSFSYKARYVKLVEIDQKGLPGGCSTYVLVSANEVAGDHVVSLLKGYIKGRTLEVTTKRYKEQEIILKTKIHPVSNDNAQTANWRGLLLKLIA